MVLFVFQITFNCHILIFLWDHKVYVHMSMCECCGYLIPVGSLGNNTNPDLDPDPALSSGQPTHAALHTR